MKVTALLFSAKSIESASVSGRSPDLVRDAARRLPRPSGLPMLHSGREWLTDAVGLHSGGTVRDLHPLPYSPALRAGT